MKIALSGESVVRADRSAVWAALHDVDVLARCIPGCRSLRRTSDRDYALVLGLVPLGLVYAGAIRIAGSEAPRRLHLVGEGGGRAGRMTGTADFTLDESAGRCRIQFVVDAAVTGLPALAGRGMTGALGRMIASIFATRFGDVVSGLAGADLPPVRIAPSESKV